MAENPNTEAPQSADDQAAALMKFVSDELAAKTPRDVIAGKLEGMGVEKTAASKYVFELEQQINNLKQAETFEPSDMLPAVIGALAGAVLGGIAWGYLAIWTNKVYSAVALLIGFMAGYGTVLLTRGKKGPAAQMVAEIASIIGVVVGTYISFFHIRKEETIKQYGQEAVKGLTLFSPKIAEIFFTNITSMFSPAEYIFIALAVYIAWSVPKASFK